ncbi:hypothetical protein, partial [Cronobacter sakazakii]|uniref:hypothetical protein n=1 Tax=Cronobacter sakazakii TaxID=28141 RepID=UPI001F227DA3
IALTSFAVRAMSAESGYPFTLRTEGTAPAARFTVSCKPRFWIMVDFGTHGMIGAFKREIQSADWLCKSINK